MKTENYKLYVRCGDDFTETAKEAKHIAVKENITVEFTFNEITCLVNVLTNLNWLYRDYCNAHRMEWKTIGADCPRKYSKEVLAEIKRRDKIAEEEAEQQRKEWQLKDEADRKAFEEKTKGIELELSDRAGWEKSRKANTGGYGSAALDYAEGWAKLMQIEIAKGKTISDCYDYTQKGLGFLGITGFMFGCAVSVLSQTWKHGAELRRVHNLKYGIKDKKVKGTVNPAIITLKG